MSKSSPPTWLVTGTSNGLGLSLSQHILQQGHNLISLSRHQTPDPSLTTLSNKASNAGTLHHIPHDLSDANPTTLKSTITTFLSRNPTLTIDILVNNAGITLFDAIENTSPTTMTTVMTTNFFSPVYLIQSLLPQMRSPSSNANENKDKDEQTTHPKVIVNVSSTQGLCTDPAELSYDASKHAIEAMSGVLASEVSCFGIRVMIVELGSLRTNFASAGEAKRGVQGSTAETESQTQSQSQSKQQDSREAREQSESQRQSHEPPTPDPSNPYTDPTHPVFKRKAGVRKLAEVPGLARGDPLKTANILFDAVMRTEGSVVEGVLDMQRKKTIADGGNARVERLVLGSDAQPKIERTVERLRFDVESCRGVSGLIEADDTGAR